VVFAPAIGIACCQVLAALCGLIAALFTVLGLKNWLVGGEGMAPSQAFLFAAIFVAGTMACVWFARLIQRIQRGE
jgi:preprotein translocase subunit SecY